MGTPSFYKEFRIAYPFRFLIQPKTPRTKSFSLQQMKAKKTSNNPVFTTKVQTVLSMCMHF